MGKDAALRGVWIDIVECLKSGGYLRSPKADTPWRSESCAASTLQAIDDVNAAAPRRSVSRRVSSRALIIEAFRACLLSAARNEGAGMDRSSPAPDCTRAMIRSRWAAPYPHPTFY